MAGLILRKAQIQVPPGRQGKIEFNILVGSGLPFTGKLWESHGAWKDTSPGFQITHQSGPLPSSFTNTDQVINTAFCWVLAVTNGGGAALTTDFTMQILVDGAEVAKVPVTDSVPAEKGLKVQWFVKAV